VRKYLHYDKEKFVEEFKQTDIYCQLVNDYQNVSESLGEDTYRLLPRRTTSARESTFYYSTFYYLKLLLEKNPKVILDLGCGSNLFKKYIPQIHGVDYDDVYFKDTADAIESYSEEWVTSNLEKYDCAMTIGAIHNVSMSQLPDRINEFGRVIKQGGRGYFSVNLRRVMQNTELHEYAKLFDLSKRQTKLDLYRVVVAQCEKIKYKIVALDVTFLDHEKVRYESLAGTDWPTWNDYVSNNLDHVQVDILEEIKNFEIGLEPFTANGPSEPIDGNVKLVFEI